MRILRNALIGFAFTVTLTFGIACSGDSDDSRPFQLETPGLPSATLTAQPPTGSTPDRDEFIDRVSNQIDRMDQRIAEMETEVQAFTGDAGEEADRQIDEIKTEVDGIKDSLVELETVRDEEAVALQDDIEAELNEAQAMIETLEDQLGI